MNTEHSIIPMNSGSGELNKQLSPKLLYNLASSPYLVNNDKQKIAMLAQHIHAIMEIGEIEHAGDWDPYLIVTLKNGETFETLSGYWGIIFEDFNEMETFTVLQHYQEITSIGFITGEDENPVVTYYKLSDLLQIEIAE